MIMAKVSYAIACLIASFFPALSWGLQATSIIELRESAEPAGTDHTGDIVSFTAVGSGAPGTSPRPWVCYTMPIPISGQGVMSQPTNMEWQTPDGINIVRGNTPADDGVATRLIGGITPGIVLARGTNYTYPDGNYCCVLTVDSTEFERRCVTFTSCPTLNRPTDPNARITYYPVTNEATYGCKNMYTEAITSDERHRICQNNNTWSGSETTINCTITCSNLTLSNGVVTYTSPDRVMGSVATHSCDLEYQLTASNTTRTCQSDGEWSQPALVCELICPNLIIPANGMISYSDPNIPRAVGSTGSYSCNVGYTFSGTLIRTCTNIGWSKGDVIPTCTVLRAEITPRSFPMAGHSFMLTCSLTGGDFFLTNINNVSYQWRRGESLLTNSTTLHIDPLYLSDAGQYSCSVTLFYIESIQDYNVSEIYNIEFTSLHIQLRLNGFSNCDTYIESETVAKVNDITNELSQNVEQLCACGFSPLFISNDFIRCFDDSLDRVTYRAVIMKTENVSVVNIASLITEWVNEDSSIIVQSTRLGLESSCPVVIADNDSPECPQDITNPAVAGGTAAGTFIIALILLIMVVLVLKMCGNRSSQPIDSTSIPLAERSYKYEEVRQPQLNQTAHYVEVAQHLQVGGNELNTSSTKSLPLEKSNKRDSSEYIEVNRQEQENPYDPVDQHLHLYVNCSKTNPESGSIHSPPLLMQNQGQPVPGESEEVIRLQEENHYVPVEQHHQQISPYSTIEDCY